MDDKLYVPTLAELTMQGIEPEVVFWVGCAGSFDQRAQRITKAFVKLLHAAGVKFAILGSEESCTGDPARRAGNEFIFQMMAAQNIATLNGYGVKKMVTACPHCFNIFRNEYPALGGTYEIMHHTTFLNQLLAEGKLKVQGGPFKGRRITFHDSCYLGRANGIYEAPRELIQKLDAELVEMKRSRANGFCCGAGGAQVFKEPEPGKKEVYAERTEEALATGAPVIAAACPFCMTMLSTGVNEQDKDQDVKVLDVAELIVQAAEL